MQTLEAQLLGELILAMSFCGMIGLIFILTFTWSHFSWWLNTRYSSLQRNLLVALLAVLWLVSGVVSYKCYNDYKEIKEQIK